PNQTARFKITPTTAAVTAERAAVSFGLPRNCSICGAPLIFLGCHCWDIELGRTLASPSARSGRQPIQLVLPDGQEKRRAQGHAHQEGSNKGQPNRRKIKPMAL